LQIFGRISFHVPHFLWGQIQTYLLPFLKNFNPLLIGERTMVKRTRNSKKKKEHIVSVDVQDFPLEALQQFIDDNTIKGELPFELLATHYPSLLSEWYPGYPGAPRMQTEEDPIPCRAYIKNGMITILDAPGLENIPLEDCTEEGEYDVWLQLEDDSVVVHIVEKDETAPLLLEKDLQKE
jgi:hypothetical protein